MNKTMVRVGSSIANLRTKIARFNERVAVWMTARCGTMWVFYLFVLFGLAPALPALHTQQNTFLYIGNVMQLCALPLIMVGGQVIGRAQDGRASEDHENILRELEELKAMHAQLDRVVSENARRVEAKMVESTAIEAMMVETAQEMIPA